MYIINNLYPFIHNSQFITLTYQVGSSMISMYDSLSLFFRIAHSVIQSAMTVSSCDSTPSPTNSLVRMSTKQLYLQPRLKSGLRTAIQIIIPVLLILGTVRIILVTAKTWIPYEYRLSGFPEDFYGFSTEDRIFWSAVDLDFLFSDAEIDYFDGFELDSGEPMHNERELRHMVDVKVISLISLCLA